MERHAFERLVRDAAYRPATAEAVLDDLVFQSLFYEDPVRSGLEELAQGLALAFSGRLTEATDRLSQLATQHSEQPLCHFYLFGLHRQAGHAAAAVECLARMGQMHPEDPLADLLRLHLEGETVPPTTEEVRLAFLRKFGSTSILRNPYQLAVAALFAAIRETEHVRVLDIGVGAGAQIGELLGFLERHPHRVRRLDVLGLDFVDAFLQTSADAIDTRARELRPRVAVSFLPIKARIEDLGPSTAQEILEKGPLDAVNATIALHEVPGEGKIRALQNIRALSPRHFVLVEWNSFLENTLPETTVEFLYNVRRIATAWTVGLRERYPLVEVYEILHAVLAQGEGQSTCPAARRQECYLDARCWRALLQRTGFAVKNPNPDLLKYAHRPDRAAFDIVPWYLAPTGIKEQRRPYSWRRLQPKLAHRADFCLLTNTSPTQALGRPQIETPHVAHLRRKDFRRQEVHAAPCTKSWDHNLQIRTASLRSPPIEQMLGAGSPSPTLYSWPMATAAVAEDLQAAKVEAALRGGSPSSR